MVRLRLYCFYCRKLKSGQDIAGDDKHFKVNNDSRWLPSHAVRTGRWKEGVLDEDL